MSDIEQIVGEIVVDWSFMQNIGARASNKPLVPIPFSVLSEITASLRDGKAITSDELPKHLKSGQPFLDEQSLPFVLYISDQSRFNRTFRKLPKFHFRWCSKLKEMEQEGRINRYRAKYDICNPVFNINDGKNNEKLKVCLLCCKDFSRNGKTVYSVFSASNRNFPLFSREIESKFDMPKFFEVFGVVNLRPSTHPGGQDSYTGNWPNISRQERERVGWQCQAPDHIGDRDFSNNKQNLHVHHIDGVKSNNVSNNLEVLCDICHAKRHSHMQ